MQRWIGPIVISLMAGAPLIAEARQQSAPAAVQTMMAQAPQPEAKPEAKSVAIDEVWALIRTARQAVAQGQTDQAVTALTQADQRSQQISDAVMQTQLRATIAVDLAKLGRYDQAIAITNRLNYQTMPPQTCCTSIRTDAEVAIAETYLKAGQIKQAQQFAERLSSASARSQVLVPIVTTLVDRGQFADAITLTKRISDGLAASRAQYAVIKGYLNADRFTEAIAVAKTMRDPNDRAAALQMLVQWAGRSGKPNLAYDFARQISDPRSRAYSLIDVAIMHSQVGQRDRAVAILLEAERIARTQKEGPGRAQWAGYFAQVGAFDRAVKLADSLKGYERGDARLAIARAYSDAKQYAKATALARLVRDGELMVVADIPDLKSDTVNQIIRQALKAGQYDQALQAVNAFDEGRFRARALQTIARQYRITQQPQKAEVVLKQAVAAARTVDKFTIFYDRNTYFMVSNVGILVDLAQDWVRLNQPEAAIALLDSTLESARALKEENVNSLQYHVKYLAEMTKLYQQFGQRDRALAAAESAFTLVNRFPQASQMADFPAAKVQAMALVAQMFHRAGATDRAKTVLADASRWQDQITNPQTKIWSWVPIVEAHAVMGQTDQVRAGVESALRLAQSQDLAQRDWLTEHLAVAAAATDPTYAMQLIETFTDRARQIPVLARLALNYHAAGQTAPAQIVVTRLRQVAQTLPSDSQREQMLNDAIRNYFVRQWDPDVSQAQLVQASQLNADLPSGNLQAYNWALIAFAYANQGEANRATEAMTLALNGMKQMPNRFERREFSWQLFEEALRMGDRKLMTQIVNSLEVAADRVTAARRGNL